VLVIARRFIALSLPAASLAWPPCACACDWVVVVHVIGLGFEALRLVLRALQTPLYTLRPDTLVA
jgi:hypothetical protein